MRSKSETLRAACRYAIALAGLYVPQAAIAQVVEARPTEALSAPVAVKDQRSSDADSQDIIVTARKRSERLRDVPLSITAASADDLARQNITSPEGLAKITPGFTALTTGSGTPVYTIRGVGYLEAAVAAAPAVSLYVDQVPLPFTLMAQGATLDLERVEVLKGPQGTLFGQNSTGGAINYIAAKPTDHLSAGGDVTFGRFNRFDVNAFISGPITDTLRVRVAARSEQRGDWQRSYTRNDSLGQRNFLAGRVLVDWAPSESLHFELNVTGWRNKSDVVAQQFLAFAPNNPAGYPEPFIALGNYPVAPRDPRAADWDANTSFRQNDKFYQVSLRGDWDINEAITLSSISAFMHYDPYIPADTDGTNFTNLTTIITGRNRTWTQELRLAGDMGRIKWMIGGNYEHDISRERDDTRLNSTTNGVGPFRYNRVFIDADQIISTAAIFGSLDYSLTDTLTAQASARYTEQKRDFTGCLRDSGDGRVAAAFGFLAGLPGPPLPIAPGACVTFANNAPVPVAIVKNALDESNVSWRAGLNWKPQRNTLVYATVAQGYKAGGFSPLPAITVDVFTPAVQEKLIAYEVGLKTSLAQNRIQIDAAVFYYDYINKQTRGFRDVGPPFNKLPVLVNIPKSDVRGAELNVTLRPVKGLSVVGGLSYTDSRVRSSFLLFDVLGNIIDVKGEPFPSAPKWQLNGDVQYDAPVNAGWTAFVGAHVNYRTATNSFIGGNALTNIAGYALLDLRMGAESRDGKWRFQLFGDNVTNKYYTNNAGRLVDTYARIAGMPATYGIRVGYKFD